jgi:hypothetical protein
VRIRPLIVAAACASALAAPAAAHAAPLTTLKVRACHVGDTARDRDATFYARMRAIPGTDHMAIRFRLFDTAGAGAPVPIANSQLERWHVSRPGVQAFGYAQTVTGLDAGGIYSVAVEFRWLDANGRVTRAVRRRSGDCREIGQLPNLAITGVTARPGAAAGTEVYAISVLNDGTAPARLALVGIFVDGAQADVAQVTAIDPAETTVVHVTGPTCRRRIRVVVDRADVIHETTEDDNVLRSRCPAVRP